MPINPRTGKPIIPVGGKTKGPNIFKQDPTHPEVFQKQQPEAAAPLPPPPSEPVPPPLPPPPSEPAPPPVVTPPPATQPPPAGGGTQRPPVVTQPKQPPTTGTGGGGTAAPPQFAPTPSAPVLKPPTVQPYQQADLTDAIQPPPLPTVQRTEGLSDPNIGSFADQWQAGEPDLYGWLRRTSSTRTG